jgi:Tfp pilus assembly protein FimV
MKALPALLLALCFAMPALPLGQAMAAEPVAKVQGKAAAKPVAKAPAKARPKAPVKARAKARPVSKAAAKPLPKAQLDLSLPKGMVEPLTSDVGRAAVVRKPLIPLMFPAKPESDGSPFQLNGRLISNEMQLQLRNDSRRDVEGAAIDFEFRN